MKLPSLYTPSSPEEIIGSAGQIAAELQRAVKDALENGNAPIKVIFAGDPGVGKSTLANLLIKALGVTSKWAVKRYSGADVSVETVRDIAQDLHYKDLFGASPHLPRPPRQWRPLPQSPTQTRRLVL
jgi:replication-associated recombination protein RarA